MSASLLLPGCSLASGSFLPTLHFSSFILSPRTVTLPRGGPTSSMHRHHTPPAPTLCFPAQSPTFASLFCHLFCIKISKKKKKRQHKNEHWMVPAHLSTLLCFLAIHLCIKNKVLMTIIPSVITLIWSKFPAVINHYKFSLPFSLSALLSQGHLHHHHENFLLFRGPVKDLQIRATHLPNMQQNHIFSWSQNQSPQSASSDKLNFISYVQDNENDCFPFE